MTDSLNSRNRVQVTCEGSLSGIFAQCNLSRKNLTYTEIQIIEKGFDFAPVRRKNNQHELRSDIEEFCRKVKTKWHFRNEPTLDFSNVPYFKHKSKWSPPKGHPAPETF